jgi:hypothetical protein
MDQLDLEYSEATIQRLQGDEDKIVEFAHNHFRRTFTEARVSLKNFFNQPNAMIPERFYQFHNQLIQKEQEAVQAFKQAKRRAARSESLFESRPRVLQASASRPACGKAPKRCP